MQLKERSAGQGACAILDEGMRPAAACNALKVFTHLKYLQFVLLRDAHALHLVDGIVLSHHFLQMKEGQRVKNLQLKR